MATAVRTWTLRGGGIEATIMDSGRLLAALHVPDRNGRLANVVLGFGDAESYRTHRVFFGATIGRVANRIARGRFTLGGHEHQLSTNDGPNHLHGGVNGFDQVVWLAVGPARAGDAESLELRHTSPDGDEGYPGTLAVRVVYSVANGCLRIAYEATTDRPTPVNLTNHSYFNLAGAGTVLDHDLELASGSYTPVDATLIPTGEIVPVAGTPFDFTRPTALGARRTDPLGYDHNFVLRPRETLAFAAGLHDPGSGRVMELHTTEPGLQLYTGNYLTGALTGTGGRRLERYAGVCLETQHFPDAVNHPHFPSVILEAGATFRSTTVYRFRTA